MGGARVLEREQMKRFGVVFFLNSWRRVRGRPCRLLISRRIIGGIRVVLGNPIKLILAGLSFTQFTSHLRHKDVRLQVILVLRQSLLEISRSLLIFLQLPEGQTYVEGIVGIRLVSLDSALKILQ